MKPITAFDRSVKNLLQRRRAAVVVIDLLEQHTPQGWEREATRIWSEVDEIDRQIGVAYYWHAVAAESEGAPSLDEGR